MTAMKAEMVLCMRRSVRGERMGSRNKSSKKKHQTPNPKPQRNTKHQYPIASELGKRCARLIGVWILELLWVLGFGAWCFSYRRFLCHSRAMNYLIAACIGLIGGISSGLFGVGGGVVMVPAMLFFTTLAIRDTQQAVGTS